MLAANMIAWRPFALGLALVASTVCSAGADEFKSNWAKTSDRVWIGPDWWANRVEDWRIHDGRLECVQPGMRAAYLTTRTLRGSFKLSVRTGMLGKPDTLDKRGFTGFFFSNMGKDDYKTEDLPRRTHRALGQRLPAVEFIECPLEVVLSFFREVLEVEIRPDRATLILIGVTEATMANFYARGLSGRRALELTMASTVGLGQIECVVGEDGIVHIRPAGAVPLPMRAKATDTQLAVRKRLAATKVARLDLRDTKLSDVITFLRELSDVNVFVDWHSLRRIKVDHHSRVRLNLTDKPVCDALTAALHAVSSKKALRWGVDAEGMVLIHAMPRTVD